MIDFRSPAARRRDALAARYALAVKAGHAKRAVALKAKAESLLTVWDRAVLALSLHYERLGRSFYGSYVDALWNEFVRGVPDSFVFRAIVADVFDAEGPGLDAMVTSARTGQLAAELERAEQVQDCDFGALLGGASS